MTRDFDKEFEAMKLWEKAQLFGAYQAQTEQRERENPIREIEPSARNIIFVSDEIQLIEMSAQKYKGIFGDAETCWSAVVNGRKMSRVCANADEAFLWALAYKYEDGNSQFPHYAARMLGMEGEKE